MSREKDAAMTVEGLIKKVDTDFQLAKELAVSTMEGLRQAKVQPKVAALTVAILAKGVKETQKELWDICQLMVNGPSK